MDLNIKKIGNYETFEISLKRPVGRVVIGGGFFEVKKINNSLTAEGRISVRESYKGELNKMYSLLKKRLETFNINTIEIERFISQEI